MQCTWQTCFDIIRTLVRKQPMYIQGNTNAMIHFYTQWSQNYLDIIFGVLLNIKKVIWDKEKWWIETNILYFDPNWDKLLVYTRGMWEILD